MMHEDSCEPTAANRSCAPSVLRALCVMAMFSASAMAMAQAQGSAPLTVPRAQTRDLPLGEQTSALLRLQASGDVAGPGLPILGAEATWAYTRYMDSFKYRIPVFYGNMVGNGGGNSGGGGGGDSSGASPSTAGVATAAASATQ
ncbi:hypothetical protein PTE30175_05008 [Pandoraea terrae]|uniref:Lipoprotein n=1 Tax=Pandoraea terrae TaxID=1537710 RepID=A0A5E4Z8S3_9BURK|nr:DUF3613 domain-containing protein [Pandoraea terrae]VVE56593.1 hypothetical protein PTE30175_05008 [Pandoraea terrae]